MSFSFFKTRETLGIFAICLILFIGMSAISVNQLLQYRTSLLEERREKSRELVENVSNLVLFYYLKITKEDLPEEEAKNNALQAIRQLHYDHKAYFFITDMTPRVLMHPTQAELEGQDVSAFKDPLGTPLFQEMVKRVRSSGSGFIDYYWTKPDEDKKILYPKLSYVKGFEPWGWIIGSGIYLDDVDAAFWNAIYTTGAISLAVLIFVVALAVTATESFRRR